MRARRSPLPRLTGAVFRDLAIWMTALGVVVGLVFPPFVVFLGMPAGQSLTLRFFAQCVAAGVVLGAANFCLARCVVGSRLEVLTARMRAIGDEVRRATETGDWSDCEGDRSHLPVDSDDQLGDSADAFNALVDALERSRAVEAAVRDLLEALTHHLEVEPLSRTALRRLLLHLGQDAGAIVLDGENGLRTLASVGVSSTLALAVARGAEPDDTFTITPIHFDERVLGGLVLRAGAATGGHARRLVDLFVGAFGVALKNALAHQRSQEQARRDDRTGLLGARAFDESLHDLVVERRPFTLVIADVDNFKRINDSFGHQVGDETLRQVADGIRTGMRAGDVAFRIGGDEFCILLPETPSANAVELAERLQRGVRAATATHTVTLSLGIASYPEHGLDSETLVAHADAALYRSKRAGKDRLTVATTEPLEPAAPTVADVLRARLGS